MTNTVFLFPGILGEDRRLRQFCTSLADIYRFEVIQYPGIRGRTSELFDIDALADAMACLIEHRCPQGEISIAGYSFGGCVAYEVCCILQRRGRAIKRVLLIDPPLPKMIFDLFRPWPGNHLPPRAPIKHLGMLIVQNVAKYKMVRIFLSCFIRFIDNSMSRKAENVIVKSLRERARREKWQPKPACFPGLVLVSSQFSSITGGALRELSRGTDYAIINASHISMLDHDALVSVREAIMISKFHI